MYAKLPKFGAICGHSTFKHQDLPYVFCILFEQNREMPLVAQACNMVQEESNWLCEIEGANWTPNFVVYFTFTTEQKLPLGIN